MRVIVGRWSQFALALMLALTALTVSSQPAGAAANLQEDDEIEFTGTVTVIDADAGTFTVEVEDGEGSTVIYQVIAPEGFDFESFEVGDTVEVEGTLDDDQVVADKVDIENAGEEEGEAKPGFFCTNPDARHPVAQGISQTYGIPYEHVVGWFCDGFGLGQIMLALHTGEMTGESAEALLARRAGGEGWGRIWHGLELIGHRRDAGRPEWTGPPDEAGPPHDRGRSDKTGHPGAKGRSDGAGPPDWAGPHDESGPPDWAGPPGR